MSAAPVKAADPWDDAYHRLGISTPSIIVMLTDGMRDEAVFTGQLTLAAASDRKVLDAVDIIIGLGSWSPHIEHAFVFPDPCQAHRWLPRLALDNGEVGTNRWLRQVVRLDGDFHPGEVVRRYIFKSDIPGRHEFLQRLDEAAREQPR